MSTHVSSEAGAARVSLYADQNFYPQLVASHLQKSMAKDQSRAELHGDEKEPRLGFADSQLSSDDAKAHPSSQIERLTRGDIASLIEQHRGSADLFTFVKAVLEASSPADSAGLDRTLWIFEAVMTQLGDGAEIARRDDILGNLLLARANSLPDRVIAYLAQQAYQCVHGVALSPVRLLPKRRFCAAWLTTTTTTRRTCRMRHAKPSRARLSCSPSSCSGSRALHPAWLTRTRGADTITLT